MNELKEYIEIDGYPKLGYHTEYSNEFEEHYNLFEENICPVTAGPDIYFYCWEWELKRFIRLLTEKKLYYKSQLLDKEDNIFLKDYTTHFENGFNKFDYHTPKETILKYLPFIPESINNGKVLGIGRNSKTSPGLYGARQLDIHGAFTANGILNSKTCRFFPDKNLKGDAAIKWMELRNPLKHAFNDGRMFKSIFVAIDRYYDFADIFKISEKEFEPEIDSLYGHVDSHLIEKFLEIERELHEKGYLSKECTWLKSKQDLVSFIVVLIEYKYFLKPLKNSDCRKFIENRYKSGSLSESWKKRPDKKNASAEYFWIQKP